MVFLRHTAAERMLSIDGIEFRIACSIARVRLYSLCSRSFSRSEAIIKEPEKRLDKSVSIEILSCHEDRVKSREILW